MNVIWLSPDGQKFNKNKPNIGTVMAPFRTVQDAMNRIAISSKTFWTIYISPGFYPDSFEIPVNKIICFVGASRATVLGGDCLWKISGKFSSLVIFRDVAIGSLTIKDDLIPAELASLAFENCSVNAIIKEGTGQLNIAISGISAASDFFGDGLGAASVVYGDIYSSSYLICTNTAFLGGKNITCDIAKFQFCLLEQDIYINNNACMMTGTQWLNKDFSLEFTNQSGVLQLDEITYNSFMKNNIQLINGIIERI